MTFFSFEKRSYLWFPSQRRLLFISSFDKWWDLLFLGWLIKLLLLLFRSDDGSIVSLRRFFSWARLFKLNLCSGSGLKLLLFCFERVTISCYIIFCSTSLLFASAQLLSSFFHALSSHIKQWTAVDKSLQHKGNRRISLNKILETPIALLVGYCSGKLVKFD